MTPHYITDDADGPLCDIAWVTPARGEDVHRMFMAPTGDKLDGRSEWVWVRLCEGTLMLATFPFGDTFEHFNEARVCDFGQVPPCHVT